MSEVTTQSNSSKPDHSKSVFKSPETDTRQIDLHNVITQASSIADARCPALPDQLFKEKYIREAFEDVEKELVIKLAAMGHEPPGGHTDKDIIRQASNKKILNRAYFQDGSPINERVNGFIQRLIESTSLAGVAELKLPGPDKTLLLDEPGMAYLASLPEKKEPETGRVFENEYVKSYELANGQGVIHNPRHDRRTSGKETFHIADYGYPVPYDKTAVPAEASARILLAALNPPKEDMILPYTKGWSEDPAGSFVSLLVNPPVVPGIDGFTQQENMETLILAPGGCVSNLDFIERIFGNAGNQYNPSNNLCLNPENWTGDTGVIIFAPHLNKVELSKMGIDPESLNTDNPDIKYYNDGNAFLLKIRDSSGVVITIIADNYFGLGKKTIMTDASFAADRRGLVMQEHAGGALVFPQVNLGSYFAVQTHVKDCPKFEHVTNILGDRIEIQPEGYAKDRLERNIVYLPENAEFYLNSKEQKVYWSANGQKYSESINPNIVYFLPNGMSISLVEEPGLNGKTEIKLVGCYARGTFIHKSDSVSGAGKSELAKAVEDLLSYGSLNVSNLELAFRGLEEILHGHWHPEYHFQKRFRDIEFTEGRPAIDQQRSYGSLEKLLTESPEYTESYNAWLKRIPMASKLMALHLHMVQSSGEDISDWKKRFNVAKIDGQEGHEIYFNKQLLKVRYLRLGSDKNDEQILSTLRSDLQLSKTLKMEDDLTVSVCVPTGLINGTKSDWKACRRFVQNMERRFFNRTDGTFERGAEVKAERDISGQGNYLVNFEPLPLSFSKELIQNVIEFKKYTPEMQELIQNAYQAYLRGEAGYFCASDYARIIGHDSKNNKPVRSPNPRYMEDEDLLVDKRPFALAEIATRLHRRVDTSKQIYYPVDIINPARRLNTTDYTSNGSIVPHIAVYPPVIMQELPELMMDLITSVTGKSPSTTGGLGSEGGGTKGPFNCLQAVHYLNNQLKALALTGEPVFTTAAAKIGADYNIGHDLSIIIKEVLARLDPAELSLSTMLKKGYMEKDPDFKYAGEKINGGNFFRLTELGCTRIFGHVFLNANKVFSPEQLKPELQDPVLYIQGMQELQRQHKTIALKYFDDGSINYATPPLKSLLHIMAFGEYKTENHTWTRDSADFRRQFEAGTIMESSWYNEALSLSRKKDILRLRDQRKILKNYLEEKSQIFSGHELQIFKDRLTRLSIRLSDIRDKSYLTLLKGSIGADQLA